jgi:hypothetical protein
LRLLTYSEMSTELHYAEEMKDLQLRCGHHCAADKAAVYAALKDDLTGSIPLIERTVMRAVTGESVLGKWEWGRAVEEGW